MYKGSITDVKGIKMGHAQNYDAMTGCTAIICEKGAVAGVDVRGSAPGTRETDLLKPVNMVQKINAVLLSGGSAFGLDAASGVVKYLEENGIGMDTGYARVPIVCSAVLYDLGIGSAKIRPDAEMGYESCINSSENNSCQGIVGAGTGATVGKMLGMDHSSKSGIGTASMFLSDGVVVSAIVAVNALGDVIDPVTNEIVAGLKDTETGKFLNSADYILKTGVNDAYGGQNTTIGVVATNAVLTKDQANKVASVSHDGLAITIKPVHTMFDGDTMFCMATCERKADINVICTASVKVTEMAIINASKCENISKC